MVINLWMNISKEPRNIFIVSFQNSSFTSDNYMRVMFGGKKPTEESLVSPLVSTSVPLCLKFTMTGFITNTAQTLGGMLKKL